jgi:uncharacterized 2Fe-2S/4Fe-4S cluster protein (DUF4445 family)
VKISLKTKNKSKTCETKEGKVLSDVCLDEELYLNMRCAGNGTCGGCLTILKKGVFERDGRIISVTDKPIKALACKTKVLEDGAEVEVPPLSLIELAGKIADDFTVESFQKDTQTKKFYIEIPSASLEKNYSERQLLEDEMSKHTDLNNIYMPLEVMQKLPEVLMKSDRKITVTIGRIRNYWFMINVQAGDKTKHHLAVAIDIGTTTVAGILVDLYDGIILGRASRYNQQITVADDVSSRISYCSNATRVKKLQELIVKDTINPILEELCHETAFDVNEISRMAICGNTVMMHLLLGLNPQSIGKIPFNAVTEIPGEYLAKDIGLSMIGNGIIDMVPSISGYVGGDITADIYVAKMHERKELTAMVDIGTNGEMVVSYENKIMACATPAGPAFEGAGLHQGCRASFGAIESVNIDKEMNFSVSIIGDTKARGICGSGIIDFIAQARKVGLINMNGRYDIEKLQSTGRYIQMDLQCRNAHACILAFKEESSLDCEIVVTEQDIAKILQAKAAIYSGLKTLIHLCGFKFKDVARFILAGGFSSHIDIANAKILGLIPDIDSNKIEVIGNGSLAGSFLGLIEPDALNKYREIANKPEVIELNLTDEFQNNFIEALMIPNCDEEEFPNVCRLIA